MCLFYTMSYTAAAAAAVTSHLITATAWRVDLGCHVIAALSGL